MRRHYLQINGELHEVVDGVIQPRVGPDIMPDIQPYQSMLTGETITSRSRHREHLKAYGYEEVGNDSSLHKPYQGIPDVAPQQRKELIRAQVDGMTHEQWKKAVKRSLDNIRWNSRER